MLRAIFETLDKTVQAENLRRAKSDDAQIAIRPCKFQVLGQFALVEAHLSEISTRDIDAKTDAEFWVKKKFDELLQTHNLIWDPHSHEIKMPAETEYDELYSGEFVTAVLAQPEYILISKALYAAAKNRGVFEEYFAVGPSKKFLNLAKKYKIELKKLIGK